MGSPNDTKALTLTRSQVAQVLDVSVSSVRRLEGTELHPVVDDRGVRHFDSQAVNALAAVRAPRPRPPPPSPPERTPGQLAAQVFHRFERRHGLSQIVRELQVEPATVRRLYHEWRQSLELVEQERKEPGAPVTELQRFVRGELSVLLDQLPGGEPTEIAVAIESGELTNVYGHVTIHHELGTVTTFGPLTIDHLRQRFGQGKFRFTAYSPVADAVLWEVYDQL